MEGRKCRGGLCLARKAFPAPPSAQKFPFTSQTVKTCSFHPESNCDPGRLQCRTRDLPLLAFISPQPRCDAHFLCRDKTADGLKLPISAVYLRNADFRRRLECNLGRNLAPAHTSIHSGPEKKRNKIRRADEAAAAASSNCDCECGSDMDSAFFLDADQRPENALAQ